MASHPFVARFVPQIDSLVRMASPAAVPAPAGLLVALSGGPDSVALLLVAREWAAQRGAPLEAAHLNHRLRAEAADADEEFCRELCHRLGILLHARGADPRPLARRRGLGLEEAGRLLRRRFLATLLAARPHLGCAATGHHRDDQAETVVMRLFRGAGFDGLRGIRPVAGRVIHPLLKASRPEILAYLEAVGQPYRIDATNAGGDATRSRVRRELLPLARDIFGPGAVAGPARLPDLLEGDAALLYRLAREALERAEPADASLAIAPLAALERPLARRVIRLLLRERCGAPRDIGRGHVDALLDWLPASRSGSGLELPGGWRAVREFDRLRLLPPARHVSLTRGGSCHILVLAHPSDREPPLPPGIEPSWLLTMPAAALKGEPRLRPWRAGDRLRPAGLQGHKKVSDLLREGRVPRGDRPGILVIEDEVGLLAVAGLTRDERTRLLPGCEAAVTLAVIRAPAHEPKGRSEP